MGMALKKTSGHDENTLAVLKRLLNASELELAYILDTNPRTIYRWLEDGPPANHTPLENWRELMKIAKKTLKEEAIAEWFHEPNRALGGSIPIRLAGDPRGFEVVRNLLGNAAHGNPL